MPDNILINLGARRAELEAAIQRQLIERDAIDSFLSSYKKLDELRLLERAGLKTATAKSSIAPEEEKTPYQSMPIPIVPAQSGGT